MRICTANKSKIVVQLYYKEIRRMGDVLCYRFKWGFKKGFVVLTNIVEIISMALARASHIQVPSIFYIWMKKMGNYFINFLLKYSMSILLVFKDKILKYILYGRKNYFSVYTENLKKKSMPMLLEKDYQSLKWIWQISF